MKEKYLTVHALTKYIKRKIDMDKHLQLVYVKGEISNFNHHSRGHMYLTIKDDYSRIQAVMFASNNKMLKFVPEDGMNVLIRGRISVFERSGQYQLYIDQMEPDGLGALYLAFEQLKDKLFKEGYFDKAKKKTLPLFPKHIAVITSPTGAAIRDIITTLNRRYPLVEITVIPVHVQGSHAVHSIVQAIHKANTLNIFDLIIVGRGGGSIEDLWAFNEEEVAKAIYHSKIPIISAVGHETDVTISDYVADVRASTPTGAAELAVPSQTELAKKLNQFRRTLNQLLQTKINNEKKHAQRLMQSYAFRYPLQLILQKEQELDQLSSRVEKDLLNQFKENRSTLKNLKTRLHLQHPQKRIREAIVHINNLKKQQQFIVTKIVNEQTKQFNSLIDKLTLLNPLEIMKRGFALPYTMDQKRITTIKQVNKNDNIIVTIHDGQMECTVSNVKEGDYVSR